MSNEQLLSEIAALKRRVKELEERARPNVREGVSSSFTPAIVRVDAAATGSGMYLGPTLTLPSAESIRSTESLAGSSLGEESSVDALIANINEADKTTHALMVSQSIKYFLGIKLPGENSEGKQVVLIGGFNTRVCPSTT